MNSESDALAQALKRLPHGPEFRFVDSLLALDPGRNGVGSYRVRGDEPFLRGHFPGEPLFPGVLLVEALAQMAGVVAQSAPDQPPLQELKLTALHGVKILGTARPGQTLRIEVQIDGRMAGLVQARGKVFIGDQQVLEGILTLSGKVSQTLG